MTELTISPALLISLLALAGALLLIVRLLRWSIPLLPVTVSTRRALVEFFPLFEICLGALFLVFAVRQVVRGNPIFGGIAILGILFYGLWMAADPIREVVAGVLLRAGRSVGVGDRVRVAGLEGRVTDLGYRVLTLELGEGDESLIPYSLLSREAIVRTPHVFGAHRHSFMLPEGTNAEAVRRTVLLCHWSSVSRLPVVERAEHGVEVTVYALDPERGAHVESFVRSRLITPSS